MGTPQSYRQIFNAASIIGSSAFLNMFLTMFRNKITAVLLGTSGMGLLGLFISLNSLASTAWGGGVAYSATRKIAECNNNFRKIALIVVSLRRFAIINGLLCMILLAIFSPLFSEVIFGSQKFIIPIICCGFAIFFTLQNNFLLAILQGYRDLYALAKIRIGVGLIGILLCLPCYYFWGHNGIVPFLILLAFGDWLLASYFVKKYRIRRVKLSWHRWGKTIRLLLSFGLYYMFFVFMADACNYFQNILLLQWYDLSICGIFQASRYLSGLLLSFILGAMGTDYYPRLAKITRDKEELNNAVNDQQNICLLLVFPGILAVMLFAPLAIKILYTDDFLPAVELIRFFSLSSLLQTFSFALSYLTIAHGDGKMLIISEMGAKTFETSSFCFLIWSGIYQLGALSLIVSGIVYLVLLLGISHWRYAVHVNKENFLLLLFMLIIIVISLGIYYCFQEMYWGYVINSLILFASSSYCLISLSKKLSFSLSDLCNRIKLRFYKE